MGQGGVNPRLRHHFRQHTFSRKLHRMELRNRHAGCQSHPLSSSLLNSLSLGALIGWINNDQKEVKLPYPPTKQILPRSSAYHSARYSEFEDLRRKLLITFPNAGAAMPPLPPKSVLRKTVHLFARHSTMLIKSRKVPSGLFGKEARRSRLLYEVHHPLLEPRHLSY